MFSTTVLAGRTDPFYVATLDFPTPSAAELLAQLGFGGVALDFEHGRPDWDNAQNIVRACELAGAIPIARVAPGGDAIAACLDMGITTLQLAQVDSVEDIEIVLRQCRFAPRGIRGIGRARANRFGHFPGGYPAFAQTAQEVSLVVHIESVTGVRHLPELLAVDEIHVIVVGAQDLAASLGHLGDSNHPEVQRTIDGIAEAVAAAGKVLGMSGSTASDARAALARGARFILASQARLMSTTANALLSAASTSAEINSATGALT